MNRLRLLGDYLWRAPISSGMPVALAIEVTNRCNFSCSMCPREEAIAHPFDMPLDLFRRIVDEAKDYVEFISFSFRGEPLLNSNVFWMIDYARTKGIRTSLSTNGMLLSEENCALLLETGLDLLVISIDAATSETYSKIRRGGDFHSVVNNAKRIIELRNRNKRSMLIVVQMISMEENRLDLESFKSYWKAYKNVLIKIKPLSSRAGLVGAVPPFRDRKHIRCSRIWKSLVISSNGIVVPCCNDFLRRYPLGDLNMNSIKEIWNGGKFIDFRRRHCERDFETMPMCKDCEFLRMDLKKQSATFIFDDLTLRKLLAVFNPPY